jgi:hypothetical protein
VKEPVRIEIRGKDEFWGRAFHVEWDDQFPGRKLTSSGKHFIAEREWLDDLERVGSQTFCKVVLAPENVPRRRWMISLIGRNGAL